MRVLIAGCGALGSAVGATLISAGLAVVGVRRSALPSAVVPMMVGDLADPTVVAGLPAADAVLICATPGLRRGRDHKLAAAAANLVQRYPLARLVLTSTTAVYGDHGGATVDESSATASDAAAAGLVAIEAAALRHPQALILRLPALVGPGRTWLQERFRRGETTMKGPLSRPFTLLHEDDAAELCGLALTGYFGFGVLNACSPTVMTARDYALAQARGIGLVVELTEDGLSQPSRQVGAQRLWGMLPAAWRWRA